MAFSFQMEFMKVEFNFSAMASVISISPTSLEVTGHFRAYSDYIGLTFSSKDYRMHEGARYPESKNYDGSILSFSPVFNGSVARFDNLSILPAMVINYTDKTKKVVTLGFLSDKGSDTDYILNFTGSASLSRKWIAWDSETVHWEKDVVVGYEDNFDSEGNYTGTSEIIEHQSDTGTRENDYVIDYVFGTIAPVDGSGIPYGADLNVSYQYGLHLSYSINFSNLNQGTHPNNGVSLSSLNIEKIVFPIIPTFYVEEKK